MDFQPASTELIGADKAGGFDSQVVQGNAESLKSSLTTNNGSLKLKPQRLSQLWLGRRSENPVNQPIVETSLASKVPPLQFRMNIDVLGSILGKTLSFHLKRVVVVTSVRINTVGLRNIE